MKMSTTDSANRIVVGVSNSRASAAALRKAVREAASRAAELRLVRVWTDVEWFPSMSLEQARKMPIREREDKQILEDAFAVAHQLDPSVDLVAEWVAGDLYTTMSRLAGEAALVVVGEESEDADGSGLGHWLMRHVGCPVEVVAASGVSVRTESNALTDVG